MPEPNPEPNAWWGPVELPPDQQLHLDVGPLHLRAQRNLGQWQFAIRREDDPLDMHCSREMRAIESDENDAFDTMRFGVEGQDRTLLVCPRLADRSVLSRPESSFYLAAKQSIKIFISTPLWLALESRQPSTEILDSPIFRPSDTWLGPPNAAGELCYASRTTCQLSLSTLPIRPHRAVTALTLANLADEKLEVLRIKVPVRHLALYSDDAGRLWTSDLRLERRSGLEFGEFSIGGRYPEHAPNAHLVSVPRAPIRGNLVTRAFSSLFR